MNSIPAVFASIALLSSGYHRAVSFFGLIRKTSGILFAVICMMHYWSITYVEASRNKIVTEESDTVGNRSIIIHV